IIGIPRGRELEKVMAAQCMRQTGYKLAFVTLFACLAVPAASQVIPLPTARPTPPQAQPNASGSVSAPGPTPPRPQRGQVAAAPETPNPTFNPFTALLVKPSAPGT